ncbi:hypothetical protein ANN_15447 [Periplaneta americana]|uniref:Uncharacterized protein n=1 Tax=Periplaneta americana TaxID=6978 RepID=A0ABQ8SHD0_PERAM|nr:hypothetical protein ANN_15447 [Periplaneta americana]
MNGDISSRVQLERYDHTGRKGKGVEMYSEVTAANSWIANKKGLSTGEWIPSLKMTENLAAVRSVPDRPLDGTRCKHGCPEIETLTHVLGFCEQELLLRNSRHHLIRSKIAAVLRNKGWEVEEQISCLAENGSTRQSLTTSSSSSGGIMNCTVSTYLAPTRYSAAPGLEKHVFSTCHFHYDCTSQKMFQMVTIDINAHSKAFPERSYDCPACCWLNGHTSLSNALLHVAWCCQNVLGHTVFYSSSQEEVEWRQVRRTCGPHKNKQYFCEAKEIGGEAVEIGDEAVENDNEALESGDEAIERGMRPWLCGGGMRP